MASRRYAPRYPRYYGRSRRVLLSAFLGGEAETPDYTGSTLTSSTFALTANGSATTTLEATVYKNGVLASGETVEFTVERVSVESAQSFVGVEPTVFDADGVATTTITVQAKSDQLDGNGEYIPLPGIPAASVVIASTGSNNTLVQPSVATDAAGATTGTLATTTAEVKTITATIAGLALSAPASATADAGGTPPVDPPSGDPFYEQPTTAGNTRTGSNGFTWSATASTVTEQVVPAGRSGYGLRHRFAATASGGDASAEQRFTLGRDCSELWIEYDLYVPANFAHRNDSPNNNKFLMLWRDTYGSLSGTWQVGYEFQTNSSATPNSLIRPMSSKESGTNALYVTSSGLNHPDQNKPFIGGAGPITPGGWYQIRHHVKASSASGVADGVMEMWVDGVLFAQMTNGLFRNYENTPSDTVIRRGYFMGAQNSGYAEETDFYTYNAKFYDTDPGWV